MRLRKKILKITLKKSNPILPSTRHLKYITKYLLAKQNRILKFLIYKIKQPCGKSTFSGKTLLWGRHSGCKKLYRQLCFFNQNTLGIILFTTYDPNRTGFISAFFNFFSYKFSFIPAIINVAAGSLVGCKNIKKTKYSLGFRYKLNFFRVGLHFCLLSIKPNKIAQYSRAAGSYCQLISKSLNLIKVRLPSNKILTFSASCFATLGVLSNKFNRLIVIGKAGRNVLFGLKPRVRGVAMNPVDNPHGGRTNGGCCWVTPWGKSFLFKKTSNSKYKTKFFYKKHKKKLKKKSKK
jgi:large subunit ribosomal protein L2